MLLASEVVTESHVRIRVLIAEDDEGVREILASVVSFPGWDGHVTLELSNVANLPITIYPGMKIGQLSFVQLTEPAERPYGSEGIGSKYQGQRGPTPSRYWQNFRDG